MKDVKHLRVRAMPLLAVLSLLGVLFSFTKATADIGVLNFWSLSIFAGTILFALLSLVSLALAVSVPREEIHKGVRIHSLLVSTACCIITLFFSAWHLIGLRLWAP
jgi:hypothetical protein